MRTALLLLVTAFGGGVFAYEPIPARSYTKPTADGRHLLVMIVPKGVRNIPNDELRAKYGQSGLYPIDAPTRPRWTCDWYVQYESGVVASNDGEYAVRVPDRKRNWRQIVDSKYRIPPRPPGVANLAAAIVYRNGQLHRTVTLGELFDCSMFTNADCDGGPECSIDRYSDSTGRVTIRTAAGGVVLKRTIDFRTGDIFLPGIGEPSAADTLEPGNPAVRPPGDRPGELGPTSSRSRLPQVILTGLVVVIATTLAFLTLAFVLIRGQPGNTPLGPRAECPPSQVR